MINSKKNILFFLVVSFILLSLAIGVVRALSWRSSQIAFAEEAIQEKKEYCDSLNGIYNSESEKNFCNFEETKFNLHIIFRILFCINRLYAFFL